MTQVSQQEVKAVNNYTTEQIFEKLSKRIDYHELARILEGDLNHIANAT
jgi:hypothetical protein